MAGEPMAALLENLPAAGEADAEPAEADATEGEDKALPTVQVAERSAMANFETAVKDGAGIGKAARDLIRVCIRKYGSK